MQLASANANDALSSIGYFVRLLEVSGRVGARGDDRECLTKGHARCIWEFRWGTVTGIRKSMVLKAMIQ